MNLKKHLLTVFAASMLLMSPSVARADSFFPSVFPFFPDLGGKGDVAYDTDLGRFTFAGLLASVQISSTTTSLSPNCSGGCDYSLTALIDSNGAFAPNLSSTYNPLGSSISIQGGVPDFGSGAIAPGSSLLRGNLIAFNLVPGDPDPDFGGPAIFEFLVSVTSSDPRLGFGSFAGVRISPYSLSYVDFDEDFGGSADGFARVNASMQLPEPGAIVLLGTGLAYLYRKRSAFSGHKIVRR